MKRIFCSFIIFLFLINVCVYAENSERKRYEILLNLCKSIADKGCFLKYYSFLYDLSNKKEKKEILKKVEKILDSISSFEYHRINFDSFKKNIIYLISKSYLYKFDKDKNILQDTILEGDSLGYGEEIENYIKSHFIENININNLDITTNINQGKNFSILFLLPLSGNLKNIGEKCLEGILSSTNFFNSENSFNLLFIDTEQDKDTLLNNILNIYKKYPNIKIIIGPLQKQIENICIIAAKQINIPIISLVPDNSEREFYSLYFNHGLNLKDEIAQLSDIIRRESYSVGVFYPESNFGLAIKNYFIKSYGTENTIYIPYKPSQDDFKSQIITLGDLEKKGDNEYIQRREIDSLFIADDVDKALLIIPQLFFYDLRDLKIYGTNLWNNSKIFKLEKKFQKSITYLGLIDYNSKNKNFLNYKKYLKKYFNDIPSFYNTLLYDTMRILFQIDLSNNDTIKSALLTKKFFLFTGITTFDNNGENHKKFKIFKIRNGKLEIF